jgi:two-component system, OmpR family, alkaline phosphatase synthesis response regulator PhoP
LRCLLFFLPQKDTENDLLSGFSLGADDYLQNHSPLNELIARVKAVLKRTESKERKTGSLEFGNIELDNVRKRVLIDNEKIDLTKKEYEILFLLLENKGKVFREKTYSKESGEMM